MLLAVEVLQLQGEVYLGPDRVRAGLDLLGLRLGGVPLPPVSWATTPVARSNAHKALGTV